MAIRYSRLLTQFESLTLSPEEFGHREHVQVAFEMLRKYGFLDACIRISQTINTMATNAGAADKFHVTITFAFLSLIAERIAAKPNIEFEEFLERNSDLLSMKALNRWYSKEQLSSEFARTHFLLPGKAA